MKWKKRADRSLLFIAVVLLSSCGGLGITETSFLQKNLTEFSIENNYELQKMDPDAVKKLLIATGKVADNTQQAESEAEEYFRSEWYYCSWESTSELTAFTIYESADCVDQIYYIVFSGSEFVSEKIVASMTNCGDWEQRTKSTKNGNSFSLSNYELGYGGIYPLESLQKCEISLEGKIECADVVNLYPGVSLWNGLALRKTPDKKGKFITQVNIGEEFTTADSVEVSQEDEYVQIRLKDGTTGYILNRLVMREAIPAAILIDAPIYRRPDELTKTSDTFYAMDVVGYSEMEDDYQWMKVKGRPAGSKWFKEGWIKSDYATRDQKNVAIASLVKKALEEKDDQKRLEMLEAIRSNSDFKDAVLMDQLNYMLQ